MAYLYDTPLSKNYPWLSQPKIKSLGGIHALFMLTMKNQTQPMKWTYIRRKKISFNNLMLALMSWRRLRYMIIRLSLSTRISFNRPINANYDAVSSSKNIKATVSKGTVLRKSIVNLP